MKTIEDVIKDCQAKGWRVESNGMEGGQYQINIFIGAQCFSWWPKSKNSVLFLKRANAKNLKLEDVSPDDLISILLARAKK